MKSKALENTYLYFLYFLYFRTILKQRKQRKQRWVQALTFTFAGKKTADREAVGGEAKVSHIRRGTCK